ncbi:hypothetical protein Glove_335g62 [Diversispora epigaea]|uniref:Uncharacterized protein n=1 Tax=Diversispora epigaea TaxID=1348612 RepID=A0A397HNK2_9GLOM|nr:hypothetical protein Glove_335g62 [Diversispora epigaea]
MNKEAEWRSKAQNGDHISVRNYKSEYSSEIETLGSNRGLESHFSRNNNFSAELARPSSSNIILDDNSNDNNSDN